MSKDIKETIEICENCNFNKYRRNCLFGNLPAQCKICSHNYDSLFVLEKEEIKKNNEKTKNWFDYKSYEIGLWTFHYFTTKKWIGRYW